MANKKASRMITNYIITSPRIWSILIKCLCSIINVQRSLEKLPKKNKTILRQEIVVLDEIITMIRLKFKTIKDIKTMMSISKTDYTKCQAYEFIEDNFIQISESLKNFPFSTLVNLDQDNLIKMFQKILFVYERCYTFLETFYSNQIKTTLDSQNILEAKLLRLKNKRTEKQLNSSFLSLSHQPVDSHLSNVSNLKSKKEACLPSELEIQESQIKIIEDNIINIKMLMQRLNTTKQNFNRTFYSQINSFTMIHLFDRTARSELKLTASIKQNSLSNLLQGLSTFSNSLSEEDANVPMLNFSFNPSNETAEDQILNINIMQSKVCNLLLNLHTYISFIMNFFKLKQNFEVEESFIWNVFNSSIILFHEFTLHDSKTVLEIQPQVLVTENQILFKIQDLLIKTTRLLTAYFAARYLSGNIKVNMLSLIPRWITNILKISNYLERNWSFSLENSLFKVIMNLMQIGLYSGLNITNNSINGNTSLLQYSLSIEHKSPWMMPFISSIVLILDIIFEDSLPTSSRLESNIKVFLQNSISANTSTSRLIDLEQQNFFIGAEAESYIPLLQRKFKILPDSKDITSPEDLKLEKY